MANTSEQVRSLIGKVAGEMSAMRAAYDVEKATVSVLQGEIAVSNDKLLRETIEHKLEIAGNIAYTAQVKAENKELVETVLACEANNAAKDEKIAQLTVNSIADNLALEERDRTIAEQDADIAKHEVGYAKRDAEADALQSERDAVIKYTEQLEQGVVELTDKLRESRAKTVRKFKQLRSTISDLSDTLLAYQKDDEKKLSEAELVDAFKREYAMYTSGTVAEIDSCARSVLNVVKDQGIDGEKVLPFIRALATGSTQEKSWFGCLFARTCSVGNVAGVMNYILNNLGGRELNTVVTNVCNLKSAGFSNVELASYV